MLLLQIYKQHDMKKIIIIFLGVIFFGTTSAKTIPIQDFERYKAKDNFFSYFYDKYVQDNLAENQKICYYYKRWTKFVISPICFLTNDLPKYNFTKSIDIIFPYISDFKNIYNLEATWFNYDTAQPIFTKTFLDLGKIKKNLDKQTILHLAYQNIDFEIDEKDIAYQSIKNYSFFVADKDLKWRAWCRLVNYNIAINLFNNKLLKPWETYNTNKEFAQHTNEYCGHESGYYLFYGWVCGASTQLFRVSLINPYIKVLQRYWHSQRYVWFYGNYIYGDDAAIYQRSKQFEIQNIWEKEIYFKVWEKNGHKYLLSVYPDKNYYTTKVQRQQVSYTKAYVGKQVLSKIDWTQFYQQWRTSSYYWGRNYEQN